MASTSDVVGAARDRPAKAGLPFLQLVTLLLLSLLCCSCGHSIVALVAIGIAPAIALFVALVVAPLLLPGCSRVALVAVVITVVAVALAVTLVYVALNLNC
jgi:hypothetical protein